MVKYTRRELAPLGILGALSPKLSAIELKNSPERTLRFAHFTDIHMEPKRNAPQGLTAALKHMQALEDTPELLITGGDLVMDAFAAKADWTDIQYQTLEKVLSEHCRIPTKHCIGNHDIWGWNKKYSETTGDEALWGKKRPIHEFQLPNRYYSFSRSNWHFLILDSMQYLKDYYLAKFDDDQFKWIKNELQTNRDKHIVIISHIPILSAAAFFDGQNEETGQWVVPGQWVHIDARKLKDLFRDYPNVKLCISGHLHMVDRVEYNGVTYICDGAVCGAWWKGDHEGFDEGYGVFDLYADGTFAHQYVSYGWQPPSE